MVSGDGGGVNELISMRAMFLLSWAQLFSESVSAHCSSWFGLENLVESLRYWIA
jgi:hypothetical protein